MNLFSPRNGASDMHFILCSHRRGIAKFDNILQTSFSYFAKKGPKGTRGNGFYNSFPSKDRQDFKAPTPKNGVRIKNKKTTMHMFPSPSNFMDEISGFIWELTPFGNRKGGGGGEGVQTKGCNLNFKVLLVCLSCDNLVVILV
jgi:hypothetical protein